MPGIADSLALLIALLLIGAAHYYRVTRRAERMRLQARIERYAGRHDNDADMAGA